MNNNDDKYKLKVIVNAMEKLSHVISVIAFLAIAIMLLLNISKAKDIYGKLFMTFALLILLFGILSGIFNALKMEKVAKIFYKIPTIIFMTFWMVLTVSYTYVLFISKDFTYWWIVLLFWLLGIVVIYRDIIKK